MPKEKVKNKEKIVAIINEGTSKAKVMKVEKVRGGLIIAIIRDKVGKVKKVINSLS